jgi:pyruvate carboxylase subunit B
MLKDAGFIVPEINMKAYMQARTLNQEFIDEFLGYWINPKNREMSSLLIGCGLPGGMMGSMMADLENVHQGINQTLISAGKEPLTIDELLIMLFEEVQYVWPKLGYPPLVTPFSQYVKNIALVNVMLLLQGKNRWEMIDKNSWDMILGKAGKLPGPLANEIIELAKKENKEFYQGNPQDAYPDELDKYRQEMIQNNWDFGENDEELFEFAMHDRQYRDYKSGIAKQRFEEELNALKTKQNTKLQKSVSPVTNNPKIKEIRAPYMGKLYLDLTLEMEPNYIKEGDTVNIGKRLCYLESYHNYQEIVSDVNGRIKEVLVENGDFVNKDDIIALVEID